MFSPILFILLVLNSICGEETEVINAGKAADIDYSGIAGEAERHKNDILKFLNQTRVQEQYKTMYKCLLSKLLGIYKKQFAVLKRLYNV